MAENQDLELNESKGGKSKLLIIIVIAVVLLAGGGGAAFFLLGGDDTAAEPEPVKQAVDTSKLEAIYVGMPRPFVFNVVGDKRDRLVQIKVQLLVRGAENESAAKLHVPLIEGALLRVFSAATVQQLSTQEGKEKLREDALAQVHKSLTEFAGTQVVERVLFTGFVMQ